MDAEINDLRALCDAKETELYKSHCEIERLRVERDEARKTMREWSENCGAEVQRLRETQGELCLTIEGQVKVITDLQAEIERLRGEVERLEDVLDGDDKAISDQEAEIDQFKQMVKDAAQALNDEERENDRLRELLREAIDKPFTLGRQSTIDAWQVVWSRRVREALGDE
jgi:chromosome segregation ATPase